MNFEKTLQRIQALQTRLSRRKAAMQKTNEDIAKALKPLNKACRQSCVIAAEEYNRSTHLLIVPDSIQFGIATGAKKIDMTVCLRYASGCEPDEDLDDADFHRIESGFRKALDGILQAASIPLSVGTILAPSHYYPK